MHAKKALFIYPITSETYREGGNSYIRNLVVHLSKAFRIVNKQTTKGLVDLLLKLPKCDAVYFNWIEDIPDRRFGFLQVALLALILALAKISNIKIIWFIHNNISHSRRNEHLKKFIVSMMRQNADAILSHSNEVTLNIPRAKFHVFHHPVDAYNPIASTQAYDYDLLVWGTVSPYKGITDFVNYVSTSKGLQSTRFLIAGKFYSDAYYEELKNKKPANVIMRNEILKEEELMKLFAASRYVLFTYNSPSVLSSAALCKTLSAGKEIIGPDIGSFKELGCDGLLHTYISFAELDQLIAGLENGTIKPVDKSFLEDYIAGTSWNNFAAFATGVIMNCFKKLN